MTLNLSRCFTARQRAYDRGSFRDNAPRSFTTAPAGWFATLLSFFGL